MLSDLDPAEAIARRVRHRIRSRVASGESRDDSEGVILQELRRYTETALGGSGPVPADDVETLHAVTATVNGLGVLQPLMDDPEVEEIWVNGPDRIFVARDGRSVPTGIVIDDSELARLVERMLAHTGRRLDRGSPFVDACLPDGSRVHVVIPDVTRRHAAINIRKFVVRDHSLDALADSGALEPAAVELLRDAVRRRRNILVSGATHSGKTTLLRALLASVPHDERVISLEETFELGLNRADVVSLQCRQANLEGAGDVSLRRLVKESLRMRPDRLVVGEVREAEAFDLLLALNSGMPAMCTIHANSPGDALAKMCVLPLLAGTRVTPEFIVPTVARCIHVVVHCTLHEGRRRVSTIAETTGTWADGSIGHHFAYERGRR